MPKATVGVVGLRSAGKTVFHATLYGRPSPLDRHDVTLAFPPKTQKVLENRWQSLESGKTPDPTALAHDSIVWELELTTTGVEWILNTMDAGGEFYDSMRAEDVEQVAGPIDAFLTRCDAILYLIDASDDKLLTSQLGTLRRVLTFNKKRIRTRSGMRTRPVGLVFTKAESYLAGFSNLDSDEAQAALVEYLKGREAGKQLLDFYAKQCHDRRKYETFPISCFRDNGPGKGLTVAPKLIHEPIFWAVERMHAARRAKARRRFNIMMVLLAMVVGGGWIYGYTEANKHMEAEQAWRISHAGPQNAKAREENGRRLLEQTFVRSPFVSGSNLERVRKTIESDAALHHQFLYDEIISKIASMQNEKGDNSLKDQIQLIGGCPDFKGPLRSNYANLLDAKIDRFHHHEFQLLKTRIAKLSSQNRYEECFREITASILSLEPSWKQKIVEIRHELEKARLDGELNRLTSLTNEVVGKVDGDMDDKKVTTVLEELGKTFLKDDTKYALKIENLLQQASERRELYRFNKLQNQLASLPNDDQAVGRLEAIGRVDIVGWHADRKLLVERQQREALVIAYKHRYDELCKKLDSKSGKSFAGDRVILINSTTWSDLPGAMPPDFKSDLETRLRRSSEEEEEYNVKDRLFGEIDKLKMPDNSQKAVDMLLASNFREGRYKKEIQSRIEEYMLSRIRMEQSLKSDRVPGLCAAFLEACPDSPLKRSVQLAHDDWAWDIATQGENDTNLNYAARIQSFTAYSKMVYASRIPSAQQKISRLEGEWDQRDYAALLELCPIKTWGSFEKAKQRANTYLTGARTMMIRKVEVESFLKFLGSFEAGVEGLELMIDEVNLSNAKEVPPDLRPSVIIYLNRTLPPKYESEAHVQELLGTLNQNEIYPVFGLARTNERRGEDVKYIKGFKIYSGEKRFFNLAFIVSRTTEYSPFFSRAPWTLDLGDSLFTANEGRMSQKFSISVTTVDGKDNLGQPFEMEFVISWKGSSLSNLSLPRYND